MEIEFVEAKEFWGDKYMGYQNIPYDTENKIPRELKKKYGKRIRGYNTRLKKLIVIK